MAPVEIFETEAELARIEAEETAANLFTVSDLELVAASLELYFYLKSVGKLFPLRCRSTSSSHDTTAGSIPPPKHQQQREDPVKKALWRYSIGTFRFVETYDSVATTSSELSITRHPFQSRLP